MHRQRQQRRAARSLNSQPSTLNPRSAFTLVEMLVSVALVVIMMAMFASVFQLAAGSIGTQRGIAENDQRARSVVTVIRNDLKLRTFRVVTPFDANEPALDGTETEAERLVRDFGKRRGFFYISENNPNDPTDDVLHFTVELDGTSGDLYFGKATPLYGLSTNGTQFLNSNEPDRDDLYPVEDNSSDSVAAEIVIFMRGGRLYRRVLLIRDPVTNPGDTSPYDVQPNDNDGSNSYSYFDPANDGMMPNPQPYTGNFWNDFDFSGHYGLSSRVEFHSIDDLANDSVGSAFPLGNPRYRFGHNQDPNSSSVGLPREYVGTVGGAANNQFIGRFTHEETSFAYFQYPQAPCQETPPPSMPVLINGGNPMDQNPPSRQLNLVGGVVRDATGVVFSGPRRAEDLLLPNVHAFDVKVWDEVMQQFVDVGHNLFIDADDSGDYNSGDTYGDFNQNVNQNTGYGPNGPSGNRVFDTWHPAAALDLVDNSTGAPPADMTDDPPPFRPMNTSVTPNIPKPLRAIQITITYYDVSSEQLRQVTQQISLVEE